MTSLLTVVTHSLCPRDPHSLREFSLQHLPPTNTLSNSVMHCMYRRFLPLPHSRAGANSTRTGIFVFVH